MIIKDIKVWIHKFKLTEPYTIAYETIDSVDNVFIQINTNEGISGFGCAAPDMEVTGETAQGVIDFCNDIVAPTIKNLDPLRYSLILEYVRDHIKTNPSAIAMLDMALFDILSKKAKIPIYKILGGYRHSIITSITIGILPIEETILKAEEFVKKGFKALKIKGGINVEEDVQRLQAVRNKVGKNIEIRFDANQGYDMEDVLFFTRNTNKVNISLLEQPSLKNKFNLLGQITENVTIPIMADESLMNLRDVFRIAKHDLTNMINIKLMKVGGIMEAMRINAVAKAANIDVMVGCMDESALAISAGLHFALSRPNIIYADLDGHFDLISDPTKNSVILKDGILYPNDTYGLGHNF